jgi:hypothetical protein
MGNACYRGASEVTARSRSFVLGLRFYAADLGLVEEIDFLSALPIGMQVLGAAAVRFLNK